MATVRVGALNTRERNSARKASIAAVETLSARIEGDIILATPVDTGALRNAWQREVVTPRSTIVGFEITNDTVYAQRVDDGSSAQASQGIVDPVLSKYGLRRT